MNVSVPPGRLVDAGKFRDPDTVLTGEARASVSLSALRTLWINTGTLCNIACSSCYIKSSPHNDRLAYIGLDEVKTYLDEIACNRLPVEEIGVTGGEPFMNPDIMAILDLVLARGYRLLVLTNAMRPMMRHQAELLALRGRHGERLTLRVSLDHYDPAHHDWERGAGSFARSLAGLRWLSGAGFRFTIAGRTMWGETEASLRAGFAILFSRESWRLDADDRGDLVLFPEMDESLDVPEISTACWGILKRSPDEMMCAHSRMIVKRKGAARPVVVACTLIPYDRRFELGASLVDAAKPVKLCHPHCARFCVLGGGACA
jgi:uncharacterized Fe-S cluster-containing radical SAM superfamily protein